MSDEKPVPDVGDRAFVSSKRRLAKFREAVEAEDLRYVLNSKQGRALLYRIISERVMQTSREGNDALAMAFNEGRRSVGISLLKEVLQSQPGAYILMQNEAVSRDAELAGRE